MFCIIYLLTNKINNKIYVGQSWLPLHKRMGKDGCNYKNSTYLYSAIQKYGAQNFYYIVLTVANTQEVADYWEDYFITHLNALDHNVGYNIKTGGSHGKHSEKTKAKISQVQKDKMDTWTQEQLNEWASGIFTYWKGKSRPPHTEEWKEENSTRMKEWHAENTHPMQGQHHTGEAKRKISEALTGRELDPESIKKSAEARKMPAEREQAIITAYQNGTNISQIERDFQTGRSSIYRILDRNNIHRLNNFSKWTGKQHSKDTKQKMSKSRQDYWDNKKP